MCVYSLRLLYNSEKIVVFSQGVINFIWKEFRINDEYVRDFATIKHFTCFECVISWIVLIICIDFSGIKETRKRPTLRSISTVCKEGEDQLVWEDGQVRSRRIGHQSENETCGRTTQEDSNGRHIGEKSRGNIANAGAHRHINIRTHIRKKKEKKGRDVEIVGRWAKNFRSFFYRKGHSKHIGRQILVNFSTLQNGACWFARL